METQQLLDLIFMIIGGILAMPFTQWLKVKFGVDDTSALALSFAVSGVVSVVVLFAGGQIAAGDFTWANLPATLAIVWSTGNLVYNFLRGRVKKVA